MQFYCTTATCLRLVVIDMVLEHVTAPLKANDWHLLFFFLLSFLVIATTTTTSCPGMSKFFFGTKEICVCRSIG